MHLVPDDGDEVMSLEQMLTASQLAEVLGFQPGTIVDWFERGELPGYRIGGRLRFRESEVVEWLEQRRQGVRTVAQRPEVVA